MKSYTDLKQSKKLAEILPIESADLWWNESKNYPEFIKTYHEYLSVSIPPIPCWSLGALLEILPKIVNTETLFIETSATLWHVGYRNVHTAIETYLIDACYELIIKLKTLNLL